MISFVPCDTGPRPPLHAGSAMLLRQAIAQPTRLWPHTVHLWEERHTSSINLLFSINVLLSLMSLLPHHALIWSRIRCNFLICDLRSFSSLSFDVALVA